MADFGSAADRRTRLACVLMVMQAVDVSLMSVRFFRDIDDGQREMSETVTRVAGNSTPKGVLFFLFAVLLVGAAWGVAAGRRTALRAALVLEAVVVALMAMHTPVLGSVIHLLVGLAVAALLVQGARR